MKKAVVSISMLFTLVLAGRVYSSGVPEEPMLRMEMGMHSAWITSIGIDPQNQFIVTGSQDKTVRLWELSTGRLVKIFRPPIGEGSVGMILEVAFSPDGKTIVCGGLTKSQKEESYSVYFFDRESGKLAHRIAGLRAYINHFSYSKDHKLLVVGTGKGGGIRIYRTSDYFIAGEDSDYGESILGVDFDPKGRLVTVSYDGFIRLYGNDFKLINKKKAPEGFRPSSVRFSPDGSNIAVSFLDSAHFSGKLAVLSGNDLSHQYSPDLSGIKEGTFGPVSWSLDGKFLYAGKGSWAPHVIRKWSDGGKGVYKDLLAAEAFLTRVLPLGDGGIVFASSAPSFGVFDSKDKMIVNKTPPIADFRFGQKRFLVSHDGATIQFCYERFGKSPSQFSVIGRSLETDPLTDRGLSPPVTQASGLDITDWKDTPSPKLNGNPLKLWRDDFSRSLAISSEKDSFLIGSKWYLYLFDRQGNQKWVVRVVGEAFAVDISPDGRFALAALGDGTVRWYRMKDGKELLAFFPHSDKKRWVLWTPSGYYDASPGAEEFIGWHVNNGSEEAADFFPVSRFRRDYYRPDVVAKALETLDEAEAIKLANKESGKKAQEVPLAKILPPVVSILFPKDGSGVSNKEIEVRFAIRSPPGEPVTRVKVLVDGRPIEKDLGTKSAQIEQDIRTVKVTIPEKDTEVSIIAENKYAVSEPVTVALKWSGKVKEDEFTIKPKLYILAIGVSEYEDKNLTLGFAAKDARDFAECFLKQKGGLYRDVVVKVLADEKATKDEIIDGFDWISKETTSKDVALVFLAGHGVNDSGGVYYYLPVNANLDRLRRTAVPFTEMKNTVASLAGKTILFIDTCHAGNVMGARAVATDITGVVNELASAENGAVVYASSTGKQYSFEDPNWGNGAFTKAVVEGINGKADYTGKGRITINMLDLYVSERVKELTKGKQTPATAKPQTIPDFPLVLKK
ncbi:MAG: caspase family protein [Candidatus Bathyarchaeia archaeon]|jgi:WD40 repeat protein